MTIWVTSVAAKKGQMIILKWAVENGCPLSELAFHNARERGDVEMLEYLESKKSLLVTMWNKFSI